LPTPATTPHVVILTRNTFDPLDTLLARLGIEQTVRQTPNPAKGVANLLDVLDDGLPAIVWADMYSLPYNALPQDAGMWGMMPVVVFGYDADGDAVAIADRARVPLTVTTAELAAARGRVKETRQRILTLDLPDPEKLPAAVLAGIWDCLKLYTEAPPKGARTNFGLAAFEHWAKLLVTPKQRMSWAKEFPRGSKLLAGLTSTFNHIALFGKDGNAERLSYAAFLDEAATILQRPALRAVAEQFRSSGRAWDALAAALLPDAVASPGRHARADGAPSSALPGCGQRRAPRNPGDRRAACRGQAKHRRRLPAGRCGCGRALAVTCTIGCWRSAPARRQRLPRCATQ
jgi:hypothetical protein